VGRERQQQKVKITAFCPKQVCICFHITRRKNSRLKNGFSFLSHLPSQQAVSQRCSKPYCNVAEEPSWVRGDRQSRIRGRKKTVLKNSTKVKPIKKNPISILIKCCNTWTQAENSFMHNLVLFGDIIREDRNSNKCFARPSAAHTHAHNNPN
jgi:hypothetical protein